MFPTYGEIPAPLTTSYAGIVTGNTVDIVLENNDHNDGENTYYKTFAYMDHSGNEAFQDALEDVHTRFILNLPPEELATADRILFQIEQAWWFYEDWICDKDNNNNTPTDNAATAAASNNNQTEELPRFKHLKPFAIEMFKFSPLLNISEFNKMWEQFSLYKRKISTYGTILLNEQCTHVILCQEWNTKSWTFPSGKINQGEKGIIAAARETYEETGFDPSGQFGFAKTILEQQQSSGSTPSWKPLHESNRLFFVEDSGKRRTCYVCKGVPQDFPFQPIARKEVAAVEWHPITDVPKNSYAVKPFLPKIKRWINIQQRNEQQPRDKSSNRRSRGRADRDRDKSSNQRERHNNNNNNNNRRRDSSASAGDSDQDPSNNNHVNRRDRSNQRPGGSEVKKSNKKGGNTPKRDRDRSKTPNKNKTGGSNSRRTTPNKNRTSIIQDENDPLLKSGLANVGDSAGWSEDDMFQANERILGRKIDYDGNPHEFVEKGFDGKDPHAFHVVGGTFMNSSAGITSLAPPPSKSRLQPLFRTAGENACGSSGGNRSDNDDDLELTPFFNDSGVTPWGEVVEEAAIVNDIDNKNNIGNSTIPTNINTMVTNESGEALLSLLRAGGNNNSKFGTTAAAPTTSNDFGSFVNGAYVEKQGEYETNNHTNDSAIDDIFLTDAEITSRSQTIKLASLVTATKAIEEENYNNHRKQQEKLQQQYENDMGYLTQWVQNMPKSTPTPHFGQFRFNVDSILNVMY